MSRDPLGISRAIACVFLALVVTLAATAAPARTLAGAASGAAKRGQTTAAEPVQDAEPVPRLARRVGYHVTPEARASFAKLPFLRAEIGLLLVSEADDLFPRAFDLAISLPSLPPDPRLAQAIDEIVVVRAPSGRIKQGFMKATPVHEFTFDLTRVDGTPVRSFVVAREDVISMTALSPAKNIATWNDGLRQHVRGAIRDFLGQLAGGAAGGGVASPALLPGAPDASSVAQLFDGAPRIGTSGVHAHEGAITFNVLDGVVLDESGRVTLVGHRDATLRGGRIPYLQHLAALLKEPEPEFSLDWTPASERAVDDLLERFDQERGEFSPEGRRRMISDWTDLFDGADRITARGRVMVPAYGVHPSADGGPPGFAGAAMLLDAEGMLRTESVMPGSPADRAGLRPGDIVLLADGRSMIDVRDFIRHVRRAGAGKNLWLAISRPASGEFLNLNMTLDARPGDPWDGFERADWAEGVLRAAGRTAVADFHVNAVAFARVKGTPAQGRCFERVIEDLGASPAWHEAQAAFNEGRLSQSDAILQFGRVLSRRLDEVFETTGSPLATQYERLVASGMDTATAMEPVVAATQEHLDRLLSRAMDDVLGKSSGFAVPPEMLAQQLGVTPEVQPRFEGVEPTTQLARVLFQADFLGKRLLDFPGLERAVPGYETEVSFHRTRGITGRSGARHMWISVGSVDLAQSPSHDVLETRGATLRFNIRRKGADGRDVEGEPDRYGDLLTSLQEPLAREFPVLHELRECAKLAAAAKWIAARRPGYRLPDEGRTEWKGPGRVPGMLTMRLFRASEGYDTVLAAVGGASLLLPFPRNEARFDEQVAVDVDVVDLRGISDLAVPRVPEWSPVKAATPSASASRPSIDRIFVPPWRPEGWVARATRGERLVQALSVDPSVTGEARALAFQRDHARCRELARRLAGVERAIDVLTSASPDRHAAFTRIGAELEAAQAQFIESSAAVASQGLLDAHAGLRERGLVSRLGFAGAMSSDAVDAMQLASDASEGFDRFDAWTSRFRAAAAGDRETMMRELRGGIAALLPDALEGTRLGAALAPVRRTLDFSRELQDVARIADSLASLGLASLELDRLAPRTEAESAALRDRLLPMQRRLSDEVDACLAGAPR